VITGPSEGARVNGTPWFTFDAEADVAFECQWDGAAVWLPCAPGHARSFVEDGQHSLVARAVDRAGNVSPESAARTFVVRSTIGTVTITGGPEGVTRDAAPVFTFEANAGDVEFACRLNRRRSAPAPRRRRTAGSRTATTPSRCRAGTRSATSPR
jgi:hypothetical protein